MEAETMPMIPPALVHTTDSVNSAIMRSRNVSASVKRRDASAMLVRSDARLIKGDTN